IPAILNANSVLTPGLLALSLVTMVRVFRGRAVFAGAVAVLAVVPATLLYAMLAGPLLPFMLAMAILRVLPALLAHDLERPWRDCGFVLVARAVRPPSVHSPTALSCLLFVIPLLVYRWRRNLPRLRRDAGALHCAGLAAAVVAAPHLVGAVGRAAS